MKKDNHWHVLITDRHNNGIRNISISPSLLTFILIFLLIILISCGVMAYLYTNRAIDLHEMDQLRSDNQKLLREMSQVNAFLDTMKTKMDSLQNQDRAIRRLEGLRSIDKEVEKLGVGGLPYIDSSLCCFGDDAVTLHNTILEKCAMLDRHADFEIHSLSRIKKYFVVRNRIFDHTPSVRPTRGRITDRYGYRYHPITKVRHFHHGVDIGNKYGTFIHSTADGIVAAAGWDKIYGRYVLVEHGYGYRTYYAHLSKILVSQKQRVTKNQIIGRMGSTGYSTGPHLHYGVFLYGRSQNPVRYFNTDKSGIYVEPRYLS